jgi:hypothetical protein
LKDADMSCAAQSSTAHHDADANCRVRALDVINSSEGLRQPRWARRNR